MKKKFTRPSMNSGNVMSAIALLVLIVGLVQCFSGALSVGITTDEPIQVRRTESWLSDGYYVPDSFLKDGEPTASAIGSPYVYGPAFAATAHAVNVILGNESTDTVSLSKSAWDVRHLVVALIGAITALAVGLAVWVLTASRRFALWAAAALLAIPIWLGMSFFNPKDIPTAAGYTFFTAGLVLALGRGPDARTSLRRGVAIAVLISTGFFLGPGTRLAMWAPLLASIVTFGALAWARTRFGDATRDPVSLRAVAGGLLVGIAAVVLVYPSAFSDPVRALTHSITDSSNYPSPSTTLTAGRLLSEHPPVWYLPVWAFASLPVLIYLLSLVGGVSALSPGHSEGGASSRLRALARRPDLPVLLVLQQALLLPVLSILAGSSINTGLRQHLYVVPAAAILAGFGAHRLWLRASGNHGRSKWRWRFAAGALCVALVVPMTEQSLLFPYNYTYINPIAGIGGVNDRWETDYWWASSREALSRVPDDVEPACSAQLIPRSSPTSAPDLFPCDSAIYERYLGPFATDRAAAPAPGADQQDLWVIGRKRSGNMVPDFCTSEDNVTRWLRGEDVVMSYVLRCDPTAP